MAAGVFGATDVFALGTDWEPQSSSITTALEHASASGADGDIVAETTYGTNKQVSCPYVYVGALANLALALDAAYAAAGAHVGQFTGTYIITQIEVDLSPMAEGKKPMVTFTGVNGFAASSNIYKASALVLFSPACAIPDIIANSDSDSELTSETYTISAQFGTDATKLGEIIRGCTFGGVETLALGYFGIPTLATTGWQVTNEPAAEETATGYSTSSYAMTRGVTREA